MTTQYIYDLVDTWNDGATTFTSIKMDVADSASNAASLLMDLQVGSVSQFNVSKAGVVNVRGNILPSADNGINIGSNALRINTLTAATAFRLTTAGSFDWSDTFLTRRAAANLRFGAADAAGSAIAVSSVATNQLTLASSHGLTSGAAVIITGTTAPSGTILNTLYYARSISAAVIELYLTFDNATAASGTTGIVAVTTAGTSASIRLATPFQRLSPQDFTGTDIPGQPLLINGSRGTGTGPGGSIIFQVAPAGSTGTAQNALATAWSISGAGNILAGTDNTYDIGASGATRPRNVYVAGEAVVGDNTGNNGKLTIGIGLNRGLYFGNRGIIGAVADGVFALQNNATTGFDRLQFGGTDTNFPALKRNGTALETKLANDTAYAPHAMQYLDVTDGVTAPASATGRARIYVDTADGDLKVIFADGTVKTIVTDT